MHGANYHLKVWTWTLSQASEHGEKNCIHISYQDETAVVIYVNL